MEKESKIGQMDPDILATGEMEKLKAMELFSMQMVIITLENLKIIWRMEKEHTL